MTVNMSSAGIMYAKISESVQTDPFGGRLTDEEYRVTKHDDQSRCRHDDFWRKNSF